jgi:hypothetical protein
MSDAEGSGLVVACPRVKTYGSVQKVCTRNVMSLRRPSSCSTIVTNLEVQDTDFLDTPILSCSSQVVLCPLEDLTSFPIALAVLCMLVTPQPMIDINSVFIDSGDLFHVIGSGRFY